MVMVTKAVSDQFGKGGIADQMIRFNGFPYLESEEHAYNVAGQFIILPSSVSTRSASDALKRIRRIRSRSGYEEEYCFLTFERNETR